MGLRGEICFLLRSVRNTVVESFPNMRAQICGFIRSVRPGSISAL